MIRGTFFAGPSITSPSPGMLPIPSTLLGDAGVRPPNVDASVLELKVRSGRRGGAAGRGGGEMPRQISHALDGARPLPARRDS